MGKAKYKCCRCGKKKVCQNLKDVVDGDDWNWWCRECLILMRPYSKVEKSILLYLETCLVDQYGRVEARRINEEDLEAIRKFMEENLIDFGRLSHKAIQKLKDIPTRQYTHWVRFSDLAWTLTHHFRKERAERMIAKNAARLLAEIP